MNFNAKKLFSRSALCLAAAYFVTFILYYSANYLYNNDILTYVFIFVQRLSYLIIPAAGSIIIFTTAPFIGKKRALIGAIPFSLARLIYFIPYFYLIFVLEHFGSTLALIYALLISILEAALAYLLSYLTYELLCLIAKKRSRGDLRAAVAEKTVLDFKIPTSFAFAILAVICFAYFFIKETVDTVVFMLSISGRYTPSEIVYTVVSYIVDILVIPSHYFAFSLIKNKIIESRLEK